MQLNEWVEDDELACHNLEFNEGNRIHLYPERIKDDKGDWKISLYINSKPFGLFYVRDHRLDQAKRSAIKLFERAILEKKDEIEKIMEGLGKELNDYKDLVKQVDCVLEQDEGRSDNPHLAQVVIMVDNMYKKLASYAGVHSYSDILSEIKQAIDYEKEQVKLIQFKNGYLQAQIDYAINGVKGGGK